MDGQQLFFLIAALVVVAMVILWALVGRKGGPTPARMTRTMMITGTPMPQWKPRPRSFPP